MRHKAREIAFHLTFQSTYQDESDPVKELENYLSVHGEQESETRHFALHLAKGVLAEKAALDSEIENAGSQWRLDRIGLVEKTIMRLATYEMLHPDEKGDQQPVEIVINEAVELAKIYASDEAPAFVNGVLDAIANRNGLVPEKKS